MTTPRREELIRALPYARRYARALTGGQTHGDQLVAEALRAIGGPDEPLAELSPRLGLYALVSRATDRAGGMPGSGDGPGLSLKQRQLLLLTSLEEVALDDAATIAGVSREQAETLLEDARARLRAAAAADVLIIEDEPIIAMDIEELVTGCGHRVVGVAATETAAVDLARRTKPGLILADINLGVGGDGTNAVARILRHLDAPVIFVTAYPERLLTGEAVEPAFVITKPFDPLTLAIATYQAVTGGVRLD
jgi:CheY-like chemotaxis protein